MRIQLSYYILMWCGSQCPKSPCTNTQHTNGATKQRWQLTGTATPLPRNGKIAMCNNTYPHQEKKKGGGHHRQSLGRMLTSPVDLLAITTHLLKPAGGRRQAYALPTTRMQKKSDSTKYTLGGHLTSSRFPADGTPPIGCSPHSLTGASAAKSSWNMASAACGRGRAHETSLR